ncbi:MAG: hypothetical protein A3C82_02495 [Candidatus Wildermuthbacteria bacterium RIFCSPHIGHO2_02_FULL_47_12]|uniref:Uncharacterized protein n=1 Tax=Candidatus Wildermuthbacteria bacterium RIFCSPHIGHO2_02_FULL_47_12 TaxID=1802451 RepID=A0A1G2R320_9BACT|nr:MAG: hypothetical protein A3C82_02495 [Candidatus Wildermuthbacteria bacterium RIFCSPHIGHO2_02_FULL_47_12]
MKKPTKGGFFLAALTEEDNYVRFYNVMNNRNRQMHQLSIIPACEGLFSYVGDFNSLFSQGGFYVRST